MTRVIDVVRKLAPRAAPAYLAAFDQDGDALAAQFAISSPLRLAHFLARALSETGGFVTLVESANYTRQNLADQWELGNGHKQFPTKASMMSYAGKPEALFNRWYGNRMGNGPASTGDGFRYRGRGPLQPTGKAAYAKYGARMGVDLVADPDLMLEPEYILLPSLYEWSDTGCNAYADKDDALSIARIINVGNLHTDQIPNGYAEQRVWLSKAKRVIADLGWGEEPADPAGNPVAVNATQTAPAGKVLRPGDLDKGEVETLQATLRDKGIPQVGMIDGKWGANTTGAIRIFQLRAGLPATGDLDMVTAAALATTPMLAVTGPRAEVTAQDLRAAGSTEAKANWRNKAAAVIVGAPAAAGAVINGAASHLGDAAGYVQHAKDLAGDVPSWVWLMAIAGVAAAIWWNSQRATVARVDAVRSGQDAGPAALAQVMTSGKGAS